MKMDEPDHRKSPRAHTLQTSSYHNYAHEPPFHQGPSVPPGPENWAKNNDVHVNIKIDVQGYDLEVLKGAS